MHAFVLRFRERCDDSDSADALMIGKTVTKKTREGSAANFSASSWGFMPGAAVAGTMTQTRKNTECGDADRESSRAIPASAISNSKTKTAVRREGSDFSSHFGVIATPQ